MFYFKIFNAYNDAKFIFNTCIGTISPKSFCIGIANLGISGSNLFPKINKEICNALISSLDYA